MVGKFKCETKGASIVEFVGLRAKMYSYLYKKSTDPNSAVVQKHRIKGISRRSTRELVHEKYKAQLMTPTENYVTNRRIESKLHQIYALSVNFSKFIFSY